MSILIYILLFYIGFYFYRLAENHNKNKWVFGILGIGIYFIGLFIYPMYARFFSELEVEELEVVIVSLKSFLIGLLFVFISFQILSIVWSRKRKIAKNEIDKIGK